MTLSSVTIGPIHDISLVKLTVNLCCLCSNMDCGPSNVSVNITKAYVNAGIFTFWNIVMFFSTLVNYQMNG